MQVVFTRNVPKIGKRGEVKEVKPGFASNYLFPQKLAVEASVVNVKKYSEPTTVKEKVRAGKISEPAKIANKIRSFDLIFIEKADEKGTFFAGVTRDKIVDELKKHQIIIKPKHIQLREPIKHAGNYKVAVEVAANVVSEISVKTKNLE